MPDAAYTISGIARGSRQVVKPCWMRIRRYQRELYDWPNIHLDIKIRVVKADAIEAPLCSSVTRTTRQEHHRKFRANHHTVLIRIVGDRRCRSNHRVLSYSRALELTECKSSIKQYFVVHGSIHSHGPWTDARVGKYRMGSGRNSVDKRKDGEYAWKAIPGILETLCTRCPQLYRNGHRGRDGGL